LAQANTNLTRETAVLTTLTAARTPLDKDVTVKEYLAKVQTDAKAVQEAAKAAGNLNLTDLQALETLAQASVTRA
jgi:hypothetical protein